MPGCDARAVAVRRVEGIPVKGPAVPALYNPDGNSSLLQRQGGHMSILDKEREGVLSTLDREVQAIERADSLTYFSILADDAVFLPPNTKPKSGDELRSWLHEFLASTRVEYLKNARVETTIEGSFAYSLFACSWRATRRSGGDPRVMHFQGLHILRREGGGSWKIAREIWNTCPL